MTSRLDPSLVTLAAKAANLLGRNSDGQIVKAARDLYPHQWSWDTAFIAIGLATIDAPLACRNLDALFEGQWANGMVPHIVFDERAQGYFPGPDRWACADLSTDAPKRPQTSGICQPPLHAIAAWRVLEKARGQGPKVSAQVEQWATGFFPRLLAWHRFLARERVDRDSGLVQIFHGWESGMDNSPRFDGPYSRVEVGADLPSYRRRDLAHVSDPGQRPTDREYDRYLWLVEEAKRAGYDQGRLREGSSFRVGDVFFTAIFAAASDHLADLAERLGFEQSDEARQQAEAARAAVQRRVKPSTGLASDLDLLTGQDLVTPTVAGFAPLIAGKLPSSTLGDLSRLLQGQCWTGYPGLKWPLPPSTSPCDGSFRPRSYWRGPVWPVMSWLLAWALEQAGEANTSAALKEASLSQLAEGDLAEYFEPFTGEPLGATDHSWTGAVVLDWLCG